MNVASYAQNVPSQVLGTFIYKSKAYNYDFEAKQQPGNDLTYSLNISTLDKKVASAADSLATDTTATNGVETEAPPSNAAYLFNSFEQTEFVGIFLQQMKEKFSEDSNSILVNRGTAIFFNIKARQSNLDAEPITAYLILRKDIIHSFLQSDLTKYDQGTLGRVIALHAIHDVSVETQDGAIKNIIVHLVDTGAITRSQESPRQYLEFKNPYPISISGKFDPEKFANIRLYSFNCNGIKDLSRYIFLSDLLSLKIILDNYKDDYSPSSRKVSLSPDNPIQELKKERRSRILQVAAFSDFVGMDQEQPNGLIQIEARRKININTKSRLLRRVDQGDNLADRYDLHQIIPYRIKNNFPKMDTLGKGRALYYIYERQRYPRGYADSAKKANPAWKPRYNLIDTTTIRQRKFRSPYYTFFSCIEPVLLFSKLEETKRLLEYSKAANGRIDPLQLYQYQVASLGINLDVLKVSFPQLKFNWNLLHGGFYWFRTRVATTSDSNNQESAPLNSNYWKVGTSASFNPDSDWSLSFGVDYIHPQLMNGAYQLTSKDGLWQMLFDASYNTSDDGKLFFRFRLTSEVNKPGNNFTQIQMGYSLNLFVGAKSAKPATN